MTTEPILDLDTVTALQRYVRIDGNEYPLRSAGSLGLREFHVLQQARVSFLALGDMDKFAEVADADVDTMLLRLDAAIRAMLPDLPEALLERPWKKGRLNDQQRLEVIGIFFQPTQPEPEPTAAKNGRSQKARTGER